MKQHPLGVPDSPVRRHIVDLLGNGGRTAELTLLDCPFLELARTQPDVVCAVHRGLLRGALEAVGEHDVEVGLQPLVAPGRCRATITTRADFEPPRTTTRPHPDARRIT